MSSIYSRSAVAFVLAATLFLYPSYAGAQTPESQQNPLARFPVAHEHTTGWCLGYLYIYTDSIAYETTWPAADKSHSFRVNRTDLKEVGRWMHLGQQLKAVELKFGNSTYRFWWLPNEQDVLNGRSYQFNPPDAGDPDFLIKAIQNPAILTSGDTSSASSQASPPAVPSAGLSQPQQLPANSPAAPPGAAASTVQPPSPAAALASPANQLSPAAAARLRFTVAHAHTGSWCVGYLYISTDRIRYEVVQREADKQHSFDLARSDILAESQWVLLGQPQNAVEIKTAHGNYHFWLLPINADLQGTPIGRWGMASAIPGGPLLAALQRPEEEIAKMAASNKFDANRPAGGRGSPSYGPATGSANAGSSSATSAELGAQTSLSGAKVYLTQYYHVSETHIGGNFSGTRKSYLVFFPSGWVSNQFPARGLDGFDLTAFMRNPTNGPFVGKYTMTDNSAEILWQDSGQTHASVKFDNTAADAPFFQDVYIPLCRCDGVKFSGTYDTGHHDPIQFSADGTFTDGGGINTVVNTDGEHRWPGGHGAYSVRNYTLVLNYANGGQIRESFGAAAVQENSHLFTWIAIGGTRFLEMNHKP
jgi:hypothetical protein